MTNEQRDKYIIETHTNVEAMGKSISVLFKTLEGNGQPGIKQRLTKVEQSHNECLERQKQRPAETNNRLAGAALVVAVFISPVISVCCALIIKKLGG